MNTQISTTAPESAAPVTVERLRVIPGTGAIQDMQDQFFFSGESREDGDEICIPWPIATEGNTIQALDTLTDIFLICQEGSPALEAVEVATNLGTLRISETGISRTTQEGERYYWSVANAWEAVEDDDIGNDGKPESDQQGKPESEQGKPESEQGKPGKVKLAPAKGNALDPHASRRGMPGGALIPLDMGAAETSGVGSFSGIVNAAAAAYTPGLGAGRKPLQITVARLRQMFLETVESFENHFRFGTATGMKTRLDKATVRKNARAAADALKLEDEAREDFILDYCQDSANLSAGGENVRLPLALHDQSAVIPIAKGDLKAFLIPLGEAWEILREEQRKQEEK